MLEDSLGICLVFKSLEDSGSRISLLFTIRDQLLDLNVAVSPLGYRIETDLSLQ